MGKEGAFSEAPRGVTLLPPTLPPHELMHDGPLWRPSSLGGWGDMELCVEDAWLRRTKECLDVHDPMDVHNSANRHVLVGIFENQHSYCESRKLHLLRSKSIQGGDILYVANAQGVYMAVKQQVLERPAIDWEVTPPAGFCELRCMFQLNYLMAHKGIGPWFVPLLHHAMVHYSPAAARVAPATTIATGKAMLSTEMPMYAVPLHAWLCEPKCVKKPAFAASADPSAAWIYTPGGGRALAASTFESDRVLFNSILRAVLFQVWLALATAQRYASFSHNDLHTLNVMLNHHMVGRSKVFFTGFGTFRLHKDMPVAVIIDYQLSTYDTWGSDGAVRWRAQPHEYSFYNGNTMFFDVWRLASNLLLRSLALVWERVDPDIKAHLWRCAQFPGEPPEASPAAILHTLKRTCSTASTAATSPPVAGEPAFKLSPEMQWCPYLLRGVLAEEALMDPCFRCFHAGPDARGDAVYVERARDGVPVDHLDARFFARVALTPYVPDAMKRVFADVLFLPDEMHHAIGDKLRTFASNYAGFVRSKLTSMCRHPLAARARYAYMEVETLQLATHWFYKVLAREDMDALSASATLDACVCVMRGTFAWWDRPPTPEFQAYHEAVNHAIGRDDVRGVVRRAKPAVPVHFLPAHVVEPTSEHQLHAFDALIKASVRLSTYTQWPDAVGKTMTATI